MTQSLEDYLETVLILIQEKQRARVSDIAKTMNVKMPSVIKALFELKKLGLVLQEPYRDIELTAKGKRVGNLILNRHTLLKSFLEKLGVQEEIAEKDACSMEHFLSAQTLEKIKLFVTSNNQ